MEVPMATRKGLKFDIRTGREIEDDDPVLRDGQRIIVPLNMCDSKQREVSEHFAHLRADDALAQHRPGPRYVVDEAVRAHVEEVYQDEKRKLQDAWRTPAANSETGVGSGEFRDARPGDQCSLDGAPGHLNHRPECIPDRQDSAPPGTMTADAAQKIKDAAWLESVRADENAWRGPAR
jgi:hypothetical protein